VDAPILRVVTQRHGSDCSVAALAMVCHVTYEEALLAVGINDPSVLTSGLYMSAIQKAAKAIGVSLRRTRKFNLSTDRGILYVSFGKKSHSHVLVLQAGILVDTDGAIWQPEIYKRVMKATFGPLLIRDDAAEQAR
jgi:hypothetical protein